jgi:hypothetical protein
LFFIYFNTFIWPENKDAAFYIDSLGNISEEVNYKFIRTVKEYYVEKKKSTNFQYYKSGQVALTGTTKDRDRIRLDDCSDILREW